ncbi:MAG: hypothetical protein KME26_05990 [Oscillatoria princeps RMCB-10]|nr:hypothetical protein [Oscillatoria princeps RMCB-10]
MSFFYKWSKCAPPAPPAAGFSYQNNLPLPPPPAGETPAPAPAVPDSGEEAPCWARNRAGGH